MPDLDVWSLLLVLGIQLLLGAPVGLLLAGWSQPRDATERLFTGMAAPAAGFLLVDGVAGMVTLFTGTVSLTAYLATIALLLSGLFAAASLRGKLPGRRELLGAALAVALALPVGLFIYGPVANFPVSPDIDGTADGYMATMAKIGGTFPRIHTLGDEDYIEVNAPPSGIVPGANLSRLTGMNVPRVQFARSGGAWVLYTLAFPFVAFGFFADTRFRVLGPCLAAVLTYSVSMKWTYYDGSNLRMFGILGLALASGFFVRSLRGDRVAAYAAGLFAGLTLYYHQRYFIYCALLFGGFGVLHLAALATAGRARAREWWGQCVRIGSLAVLVALPFVADKLVVLFATNDNPFWAQARYTMAQAYRNILRFQGGVAFFGAVIGAAALLIAGFKRVEWRYLAFGVLFQAALSFEFAHYFLAPIRTYVDASTTIISGMNDLRPIALAGLVLLPAGLFRRKPVTSRWRGLAVVCAMVAVGTYFYFTWQRPVTARYAYLTTSDVKVLRWLRDNTPQEGTLVLNYPWQDLPDERLEARYGREDPRIRYSFETYWVAPVSERRAVFNWLNRLTHQGVWNVVKDFSPDLPQRLDELAGAYLDPCGPGSEETIRANGVTHLFVTALMHNDRWQAFSSCDYLRLAYVAPAPYSGYIGLERAGFRPRDRRTAAAIYEVLPR